ncbi:hypothetical protein GCM10027056_08300 [Glaciibacter psychrotolerans]
MAEESNDYPLALDLANLSSFEDQEGNAVVLDSPASINGPRDVLTGQTTLGTPVVITVYSASTQSTALPVLPLDPMDPLNAYDPDPDPDEGPTLGTIDWDVDPLTPLEYALPNLVVANTPTTVALAWSVDSQADYYTVLMDGSEVSSTQSTYFALTDLQSGAEHEYSILAVKEADESPLKTPPPPTISSPISTDAAPGSSIDVSGVSLLGAMVVIVDANGAPVCSVVGSDPAGEFSCTVQDPELFLTPWSAKQVSPGGVHSTDVSISWGYGLPPVTLIGLPPATQPLTNGVLIVAGEAEPESDVGIWSADRTTGCDAVATATGSFECAITGLNSDSSYVWFAQQELQDLSEPEPRLLSSEPVSLSAGLPPAVAVERPSLGTNVEFGQIEVSAVGKPGATVSVLGLDRSSVCSGVADAQGHFDCGVSDLTDDAEYVWFAYQTDAAGNSGPETEIRVGGVSDTILSSKQLTSTQVLSQPAAARSTPSASFEAKTFSFDYRTFISDRRISGVFTDACVAFQEIPENNGIAFSGDDRTFEQPGNGGTFRTQMGFTYNFDSKATSTSKQVGLTKLRDAVTDDVIATRRADDDGLRFIPHDATNEYVSITLDLLAGDPFCKLPLGIQVGEIASTAIVHAWRDGTVSVVGQRRKMPSHEAWYSYDGERQWTNIQAFNQVGFICLIGDDSPCFLDVFFAETTRDPSLRWEEGSSRSAQIDSRGRLWSYSGVFSAAQAALSSCSAQQLNVAIRGLPNLRSPFANPGLPVWESQYTDFARMLQGPLYASLAITSSGALVEPSSSPAVGYRVVISPGTSFVSASWQPHVILAIDTTGGLWQSGYVSGVGSNQSGTHETFQRSDTFAKVMPGTDFVFASGSGSRTSSGGSFSTAAGVTTSGSVYVWGLWGWDSEEIVNNYLLFDYSSRQISPSGVSFKEVHVVDQNILAIDTDGYLWTASFGEALVKDPGTRQYERALLSEWGSVDGLLSADETELYRFNFYYPDLVEPYESLPSSASHVIDLDSYLDESGMLWTYNWEVESYELFGPPLSRPNPQSASCSYPGRAGA